MTFVDGLASFRQTFSPAQVANIIVNMECETEDYTLNVNYTNTASTRSGWIVVNRTLDFYGTPVCALILAIGQYMFSCDEDLGHFSLEVPLDSSGHVTLFAFVASLQPFKMVFAGLSQMTLIPATGLNASGQQGGPFNPSSISYSLSNTGDKLLNYLDVLKQQPDLVFGIIYAIIGLTASNMNNYLMIAYGGKPEAERLDLYGENVL
jgi:hypothetical protein